MTTKICSKCGKELPATKNFFKRDKRKPLGLAYQCKKCTREEDRKRAKDYYKEHKKEIKKRIIEWTEQTNLNYKKIHDNMRRQKIEPKYCSICNLEKRLDLCSIDHKYSENPNDWIYLCRICHILFDKLRSEVILIER